MEIKVNSTLVFKTSVKHQSINRVLRELILSTSGVKKLRMADGKKTGPIFAKLSTVETMTTIRVERLIVKWKEIDIVHRSLGRALAPSTFSPLSFFVSSL